MNHSMLEINREHVVVIGATGLIGSQISELFSTGARAERYCTTGVTRVTRPGLDLNNPSSIARFFREIPSFHHVIVAAGDTRFGALDELDQAAFEVGLRSKLMGQVHVAIEALRALPEGGSVTLTSGELSRHPLPGTSAVALVNGALDSFVQAVALDVPRGRRINVVSPGWIKETMIRMGMDPSAGRSARDVAELYLRTVEGADQGRIIRS